jgi:hypothetical protein
MFMAGGNGARLIAWDSKTGRLLYGLDESGPICNLAPGPGNVVAVTLCTYTDHYTVEVRDLANGRLLYTFKEQAALGRGIFSPDGQLVLTRSSTDGTISLWATSNGRLLRTLDGGSRPVVRGFIPPAAFSRDGQYLASASQSGVELWGVLRPRPAHHSPHRLPRWAAYATPTSWWGCMLWPKEWSRTKRHSGE